MEQERDQLRRERDCYRNLLMRSVAPRPQTPSKSGTLWTLSPPIPNQVPLHAELGMQNSRQEMLLPGKWSLEPDPSDSADSTQTRGPQCLALPGALRTMGLAIVNLR